MNETEREAALNIELLSCNNKWETVDVYRKYGMHDKAHQIELDHVEKIMANLVDSDTSEDIYVSTELMFLKALRGDYDHKARDTVRGQSQ